MQESADAMSCGPDVPPAVARRAVEWILELQAGEASAGTSAAIRSWCSRHPDHQRAWQHVEKLHQRFHFLANPGRAQLAQQVLTVSGRQRRNTLKALSALLVTGATGLGVSESGMLDTWRSDHQTAIGEQLRLSLTDGTDITLNSGSAIRVDDGAPEQRIHLLKGEACIATGDQRTLPLSVEVDQGRIRPLGARFSLRQFGKHCRLAVYDGRVILDPLRTTEGCLLNSGDSTLFTAAGWTPPGPASAEEISWIEGVIVARGMPLDRFIEELGRYRPGILRVDPAVAHLAVSGTYPLNRTDQVLQTLAAALPIRLHSMTRYWVTLAPA